MKEKNAAIKSALIARIDIMLQNSKMVCFLSFLSNKSDTGRAAMSKLAS